MIIIRAAAERGQSDHGWLRSAHTFSFASYFDPEQSGFSDLLVINEDRVDPGMGFGSHSHRNLEIFTYVLEGELAHKDSLGNGSTIKPGDVQLMSAGTGVVHSEFNASQTSMVHFLQIWILPAQANQPANYQEYSLDPVHKRSRFALLLSPDGDDQSLAINQDVRVYTAELDGYEAAHFKLRPGRYGYVHVARGTVLLNGKWMAAGDGARIMDETDLDFSNGRNAEVLVFDLRPDTRLRQPGRGE
ncbi:pirin family protein [Pseudomonas sp. OIL-1]|uniref:pirin family protein n=1 Tax=Pseudomonas sp. OIL-1 TaxID=2706126 RepID=UPI0013A7771B|nr:pirin family protein [Pseudomonas sp. OIL-1]QIB52331.1 pirin family protein [Pseudomonas sp. OIL-1]